MTIEIITIQRDSLGPAKTYMVFQFMPKYKYLEKRWGGLFFDQKGKNASSDNSHKLDMD